ncbi:MAG: sugar ABC transporter permease [Caldilinea sp. CFX5]|nr:sugar ABC transporter permease [Caldilinea sp. CFX5]
MTQRITQPRRFLRWPRVRRREWQGLLYVAPWLIGFLIFIVYPFIWSIQLSFMEWKGIGTPKYIGVENYVNLFTDDEPFLISIRNTLVYTAVHVPGVMVLAFLVALLLNERVRFMPLFRTLFYLPSVTSGVATVVLWVWILHPTGLLNRLLALVGIDGPNWFGSTTWALPGLILMSLWNIGGDMVIYLAGLQGVPKQLYEAAEIDGANAWQRVRYVTLPMMTPSIFLTLILGIIGSFQVFTAALVATEGGPGYSTLFVLLHIYYNAFRYFRMGYASALAWVLFVIIMLFTIIQFWLANRWVYYEGEQRA